MKIFIPFFLIAILITSCQNPPTENKMKEPIADTQTPTLQSELDAKKAAWAAKASDEKKALYADGIKAVVETGILKTAKQKGDVAPDFTLENALGEEVRLSDILKEGPVVLTWYRGGWCPYCNMTLHRLQEELPNFKAAGATLLALTPELPDKSLSTSEKHSLEFEVLSDVGNKTAREYGIVFKLIDELADSYQSGFDLHGYNGDSSDELPLAATYVIDKNGVIQYAFLDAEYRNRAEPAEILAALEALK
jgi:peroxiredoxin